MRVVGGMTLFWRSNEVFSNWNLGKFIVRGIEFNCGEQWMMYAKAMLFGDTVTAQKILAEKEPRKQKALGRTVAGFVQAEWDVHCMPLLFEGLLEKFRQDPGRRKAIMATLGTILVEASPDDKVWGIGLEENDIRCMDMNKWQGPNKLGQVLMQVREVFVVEDARQPALL